MANLGNGSPSMGGAPQQPPPVSQMPLNQRMQRPPVSASFGAMPAQTGDAGWGNGEPSTSFLSRLGPPGAMPLNQSQTAGSPPQMQNTMMQGRIPQGMQQFQSAGGYNPPGMMPGQMGGGQTLPQILGQMGGGAMPPGQGMGKGGQPSSQIGGGKLGQQSPQGSKSGLQGNPNKFGGGGGQNKFGGGGAPGKFGGQAPGKQGGQSTGFNQPPPMNPQAMGMRTPGPITYSSPMNYQQY